ncbi:unnamed protein product [Lota lota]
MEDGVKENPAQPKDARFLSKAGWVKKASGRFLGIYKDRYIHVEKTELVVYENEDLKTCLQRLDLENFEKCLELKSFFKKNRLILIQEAKCANKIHNIKFQVQTPEEKDSWIKALSEGINRAKNKIFDEVKVDESSNLDHVTRTRPKGNRGRRPPTRIHLKEVANIEGIVGLNLDERDDALSNGNNYVNIDIKDPPKKSQTPPSSTNNSTERMQSSSPELEEPQTVVEPNPQKKIFKPPMPPSKDSKAVSVTENGPSMQADPEKVWPPKPPSKELKPSVLPAEEDIKDLSEGDPVARAGKKTDPPMTPPTEPMSSSTDNLAMALSPMRETRPPTIPPKDKKPSKDPDREGLPLALEGTSDEILEKVSEMDQSLSLPTVQKPEVGDISKSHSAGEHPKIFDVIPEPISDSTPSGPANIPSSSKHQGQWISETTTLPSLDSPSLESTRKNPSPMSPLKKKPLKMCPPKPLSPVNQPQPEDQPTVSTDTIVTQHEDSSSSETKFETASVPSVCSTYIEDTPEPTTESHNDIPTVVLTLSEPEAQQEISEQSICHSEGDSVDSGSEDTLASSTFALRGSQVGLDSFYASEDDGEDYNNPEQIRDAAPPGTIISQVSSVQINLIRPKPKLAPRPSIPLGPISKATSASVGDLLSNISEETSDISQRDGGDGLNEFKNLEREIALGLEQTKELLSCTSQTQGEGLGKNMPDDLLAKAMEKLRMANHFLREAKNFEESKHPRRNNRNSW